MVESIVLPILRKFEATVMFKFSHLSIVQTFLTEATKTVVFTQFTKEISLTQASM